MIFNEMLELFLMESFSRFLDSSDRGKPEKPAWVQRVSR